MHTSARTNIQINNEVHTYVNNIYINASTIGGTDLILAHPDIIEAVNAAAAAAALNSGIGIAKKKGKKKKKQKVVVVDIANDETKTEYKA